MTLYVEDGETGAPICVDCSVGGCRPVDGWRCQAEHCQCLCKADSWPDDADRARELDDRPASALANIARDIEHEARAYPDQLERERYPDHRELLAERTRRTA